ncbi:hypothetical protein IFM89_000601 [Coptis chinensis]|uniref:CCHC-type domain-containing protein n=1 Tax=Coptis chinensis TaxID=261450 RepID=A0A835HER6_9MAGN|nr:hypothetical protein IFM89_000601 [Coptis chinensis]
MNYEKGMSLRSKIGCFNCGESDHWKLDCPWLDVACPKPGCLETMKLRWSEREHSKGKRFLRCNRAPRCRGFIWVDDVAMKGVVKDETMKGVVKEVESPMEGGKVKLNIDGPGGIKMQIEGSISDVTEIVKKLSL